ncbi:hypothetical protein K503DRAFT_772320 [Rhizopogon vinicolor AM-OR11-026]|uniref:Uncharacterized protein n=1 Tax=Rhizopogon vinicolor AM-OR11-026 TaxID=1314800 RepID=A0A1B7MVK5_9AGAM|nr:hypothetical protein K503DRAFT_772320 [Rhizopogon vinicolor AM-OR11-026]
MSASGYNRRCGAVISMHSRKRARMAEKSSSWLDNVLYGRTNSSDVRASGCKRCGGDARVVGSASRAY